jgi:hypothetical protein
LLVPLDRELLQQAIELKRGWLAPFKNGFDNARREQRKTQDATEVGFVDALGLGEVAHRTIAAGLQHVAPAMGANDSFDEVLSTRDGLGIQGVAPGGTFEREKFPSLFENVSIHDDGEWIETRKA